jgi:hypothetical protein
MLLSWTNAAHPGKQHGKLAQPASGLTCCPLLPPAPAQVEGLSVVAACGPPGGGRQELPRRFLHQFALLAAPAPGEESMRAIFGAITGGFLDVHFAAQAADLRGRLLRPLVDCAVEVYQRVGH